MDIHPPHRAVTSVRQFLRELVTITAGILIALTLEGLVNWRPVEAQHAARDRASYFPGDPKL